MEHKEIRNEALNKKPGQRMTSASVEHDGVVTDAVTERLSVALADGVFTTLQMRNFHWNVTGPWFPSLHILFEKIYQELDEQNDELAERIRAVGGRSPGTYSEFLKLTTLGEELGKISARKMLEIALHAQETLAENLRASVPIAQEMDDELTADLFIGQAQAHEKHAWMIRSTLEGFPS
jgi:starvation-inducible DNA-binding protein